MLKHSPYIAECGLYPADVVFVLDSSGSVGAENFLKQLDFVTGFINALDVSTDVTSTRFAVVTFGNNVYEEIALNRYTNKPDLISAVLSLQ